VEIGRTLQARNRAEWRRWLARNHLSRPEVWLVYHNKASGRPCVSYNEAVEEALCFGWIDSTVKKVDAHRRVQRFTPRKPGSPLSAMNKERARRLIAQGSMTRAGLDAAGDLEEPLFVVPSDILRALKKEPEAWANFQAFPEHYQRIRIAFIDGARRRPDEFERRLRNFLKMTRLNRRFGMVQ
jgi:uncharacterized protein YdeI (YjbR/CyaY-like superfamily)